jgi:hypothetical protein
MTADLQCHRGRQLPMRDTVVAERQASAGARDGVKGKRNDLAARAPLHALVSRRSMGATQPTGVPKQKPHIDLHRRVGSCTDH